MEIISPARFRPLDYYGLLKRRRLKRLPLTDSLIMLRSEDSLKLYLSKFMQSRSDVV